MPQIQAVLGRLQLDQGGARKSIAGHGIHGKVAVKMPVQAIALFMDCLVHGILLGMKAGAIKQ